MKFLNYASVALATLPTCAGQGSLRVASKLAPLEGDLETRARAHLDVLFDDARRDPARRRRLHRLAVGDSGKEATEATEDPPENKKKLDEGIAQWKENAKKEVVKKKADKLNGMLSKVTRVRVETDKIKILIKDKIKEANSPTNKMKRDIKNTKTWKKLDAMANDPDGDAVNDALDGLQTILDGTKQTADLISKCSGSSGCSGTDIAGTVFAVLGAVGNLVTVFGTVAAPIGMLISAVAAIGSFISSFFAPDPVRPVPGLDAAAVEAAAFRAVQKADDTTTFALFADFTRALRAANEFNAGIVTEIEDLGDGAHNYTDQIVDGWFDQYHNYKWEDLMSRMKDSGTEYYKAYGDITGSRRGKFAAWAESSSKTCTLDYYLQEKQKGRDNMIKCKKDMADAKTNYDFVQNFGLNYVKVATMLVAYWVNVVSILNNHSTCRGEDMDELSCKYYMSFKALQREVTEDMLNHASKLKATVMSLSKKCEKPNIEAKWPWNQKCEDFPGRCNYQYLLLTTQTDQESIVAGCAESECKMMIKEEYDTSDIVGYCKKLNTTSFYGGILGWQSGGKVPTASRDCAAAAAKAYKTNSDYSMFAIPSYTVDIPECVSLFKESGNFGIPKRDPMGDLSNDTSPFADSSCITKYLAKELSIESGGFKYELDKIITQVGTGSIGKYVSYSDEKKTAEFDGGLNCGSKARRATVKFVEDCDKKLALTKVTEPISCQYALEVTGACFQEGCGLKCPVATWSIKGGKSDLACWEEDIKICGDKPADARTKMDGHYLKAATELNWSYDWTQGYGWAGGVKKQKCTERGFKPSEKKGTNFHKPLNYGRMYD